MQLTLPMLALTGLLLSTWTPSARAATPRDVMACLDRSDLACAVRTVATLQGRSPDEPDTLRVRAWVEFNAGNYDEAVRLLDELAERGVDVSADEQAAPFRPTAAAARGFVEARGDGVVVRHAGGLDAVLEQESIETLEQVRRTYDALAGGGPDHDLVLDVFPTVNRFIDASGLPPEAVRTTGVVALSKWTRLIMTSPRALARGYGWKDTVAHEYIHLVVAFRTDDLAPVWLQEGLAKYLEGYWRGETTGHLAAHHQSLLARAVHTGEFVPFEKFSRSMAYLDSGNEAALAFAQVATMIRYLVERAGIQAIPELLDRVRDGEQAESAVAGLAGHADFDDFRAGWLTWVRTLPLVQEQLAALPVVFEGGGDEFASDPLLAGHPELARFARLGDLLRDADRPAAALVEYEKARDPEGPPSPLLIARRAACHEALGDRTRALSVVGEGIELYPEFTLLQVTQGRLLDQAGRTRDAATAWQVAHDLNPFDPEVQRALVKDYEALGEGDKAGRHLGYLRILETGGAVASDPG